MRVVPAARLRARRGLRLTTVARAPGDRLGPYALVRCLGVGGMGEVWEAVLHGPGGFRKPVALKLLRTGPSTPLAREALVREARLGALLQHPNVVATYALGEHQGTWYVALELVRGAPLTELLRGRGRLPGSAVVELGVQVAAGLAHVHELVVDGRPAALVHRDVKPGNLLVDRTGLVKIGDLGISTLLGESVTGAGTPGYMPAEQADGRATPASDVFALGATLYLVATGRRPFGAGPEAVDVARRADAVVGRTGFLGLADAEVPGLGAVLGRCLAADPARRPRAREVGQALAALRWRQAPGPTLVQLLAEVVPGLSPAAQPSPTPSSDAPTLLLPTGNLQPPRDRFVGREQELARLEALVRARRDRLLALLGPGGTGKTRLALEAARRLQRALSGGAWAFDLAEARSEDGLTAAMAAGLALELDRKDPIGQIGRVLAAKGPAVVVLDNLEHCVEALPATVGQWLDAAPEATFVCTSRVPLGLAGEARVLLDALPPDDALALFLARAPRTLSDAEVDEVPALCAGLEGMPLAIELAAARLRVMGLADLRARLGLALLAGGGPERPGRHRSLAASLAWSWDLLSPIGRAAVGQLSVFEGGFTLEAAEAVLDLPGGRWAVDVLRELVDASLVRVDAVSARFSMLLVVREYARRRAPDRDAAEVRHGAYLAQLGAAEALDGIERGREGHRFAEELDNLVAACRRALARGDAPVALATLRAVWAVLALRGPVATGLALADEVGRMPSVDDTGRARVAEVAGQALRTIGRPDEARARFAEALAHHEAHGNAGAVAAILVHLGAVDLAQGRPADAHPRLERALALHRELGSVRGEAAALASVGLLHQQAGRMEEARAHYIGALERFRATGARRSEGALLSDLGHVHLIQGRHEEARAHYTAALAIHREVGNRGGEGTVLGSLANVNLVLGRMDEARRLFEAALAIDRAVGDRRMEATALGSLAALHGRQGRIDEARTAYDAALALHRDTGDRRRVGQALGNLGSLDLEQDRLDEARAHLEEALALHRETGDRPSEGYALHNLGELHRLQGRPDEARACYVAAGEVHRSVGSPRVEGHLWCSVAALERGIGRWDDALAALDRADVLLAGLDEHRDAVLERGRWLRDRGVLAEARVRLEEALAANEAAGDQRSAAIVRMDLAALALDDGDVAGAARLVALADRAEDVLLATRAAVAAAVGSAEALAVAGRAEGVQRRSGRRPELAEVLCVRAGLEHAQGRVEVARAAVAEARALVETIGASPGSRVARRVTLAEERLAP